MSIIRPAQILNVIFSVFVILFFWGSTWGRDAIGGRIEKMESSNEVGHVE